MALSFLSWRIFLSEKLHSNASIYLHWMGISRNTFSLSISLVIYLFIVFVGTSPFLASIIRNNSNNDGRLWFIFILIAIVSLPTIHNITLLLHVPCIFFYCLYEILAFTCGFARVDITVKDYYEYETTAIV